MAVAVAAVEQDSDTNYNAREGTAKLNIVWTLAWRTRGRKGDGINYTHENTRYTIFHFSQLREYTDIHKYIYTCYVSTVLLRHSQDMKYNPRTLETIDLTGLGPKRQIDG